MSRVVVIGDGAAAHHLAERLSLRGQPGTVTLLAAADGGPSCRTALLPAVLDGTLPPGAAALPALPATVVRTAAPAVRVDRARRLVHTGDGLLHGYDRLVFATGAASHVPRVPGVRQPDGTLAEGALTLDGPADWAKAAAGRGLVAVVGGTARGVEAALALRRAGREVALVHEGDHPLDGALDAAAGALLAERLRRDGIELCPGRRAAAWAEGKLVLDDDSVVAAESLLLCTGTVPRTALARAAGIAVGGGDGLAVGDRDGSGRGGGSGGGDAAGGSVDGAAGGGILVDEGLRTSDPRVYAIGECAEYRGDAFLGGHPADNSPDRPMGSSEAVASSPAGAGSSSRTFANPPTGIVNSATGMADSARPLANSPAEGMRRDTLTTTADEATAMRQAEALARLFAHGPFDPGHTATVPLPGTRPLLRLTAPGLDVLRLGTLDGAAPLVTLSDPDGERHGALAIRDGRLAGAVLYGLPRGAAAVTQLYDLGAPVPADHLALLLGMPALTGSGGAVSEDAVVCHCNNVTRAVLRGAWQDGARDVGALAARTRATTGCGSCARDVRRLCAELAAAPAGPGEAAAPPPAEDPAPRPPQDPAPRPPLTKEAA